MPIEALLITNIGKRLFHRKFNRTAVSAHFQLVCSQTISNVNCENNNYTYPSPTVVFSASSLKLRAVFGTVPPNRPITIRPSGLPPMVMSKNTCLNANLINGGGTRKFLILNRVQIELLPVLVRQTFSLPLCWKFAFFGNFHLLSKFDS